MKKQIVKKRREKKAAKGRMKNFMMFLPNMVRLCGGLLMDARVPVTEKALFAAAIVYAISPLDLIPDIFPFIGQIDDLYLISLTLLRLLNYTDEEIVREHWKGGGDIIPLASSIANLAPKILPQRVSRVLSSRIELGSAGKIVDSVKNRKARILVEVPEEKIEIDAASNLSN
ncbi:MAG: YkvA family protein [Acidobacteriota bacterium]|nr:YkvA family protein [Acidobacteriota bacterium]MDH3528116.1 YkvA family protein [Acidobacteriota bacterium]